MNIKSVLCATMFASAGALVAAQNGSMNGGAYEINVPAGSDVVLSAEDISAMGTGVDLVKKGAGRLVIETNLRDGAVKWGGELRVEEGYLRAKMSGALGTTAKGTIVSDGATLEVDGSVVGANSNSTKFLHGEPLTITGRGMKENGVDQGVLRNVSNDQWPGVGPVTMLGDCLYSTSKASSHRLDFRSCAVNMNGHTLATRGYFAFTVATVNNPGNIVIEEGRFVVENKTYFNGSAANKFTVGADCTLFFQGSQIPIAWTLEMNDGSSFQTISLGTDPVFNTWSGPVILNSGMSKFNSDYRYSPIKLTGPISGNGGITSVASYGGTLILSNENNTFTGGVTVNYGGRVMVPHPGGLPHGETDGAINFSGSSSWLALVMDDGESGNGWTMADYLAARGKVATCPSSCGVVLWTPEGQTNTLTETVTEDVSIAHGGEGTMTLAGEWQTGDFSNLGGNVTLTEDNRVHFRFMDLLGGTLTIPKGGFVQCHTNAWMGGIWPDIAKIVVESGGCFMTTNTSSPPSGVYYMSMGRTSNYNNQKCRAIIDLQHGSCMTGRINVGYSLGKTDAAALYVRNGAEFFSTGTGGGCDMYIAHGGSGYVEIDGNMYMKGWTLVGSGSDGRGVWVQKGGYVVCPGSSFAVGCSNSRAEAYFCGGTFTNNNEIQICKSIWSPASKNAHAAVTVTGDADVSTRLTVDMGSQSNSVAALNLNGGVLQAQYIQKMTNMNQMVNKSGTVDSPFDDNVAYVNFNGGTYKAKADGEIFRSAPDGVYVNRGGAVFDTNGKKCSIGVPLITPPGKGVASISLPEPCTVPWNYIGSPQVKIEGDGQNAWAHAIFDSDNGVVTGIEVTNPGMNYTQAKATIARGGWTNEIVLTGLPLAENSNAGGITKKGKGTLTLTAANTFAGTVTVEDGSLIAQNEDALPKSEFDLNITGGVLDGGGYTWKFGDVNVSSGSLDNVVGGTASSLTKTGAGKFAIEGNMEIAGPIRVLEGSLQLPLVGAGLWESARTYEDDTVRGQEFNALSTTPLRESVSTTLEFLYSNGVSTSRWRDHMNVFYSGYIWNTNDTAQTWTFAGVMDDGIKLIIDGNVIFSNTGWETPKAGKITVEPGPHRIFISMYNGTGGAGAKGTSYYSWPKNHGLVWAPVGEPVNPNDGLPSTNYVDYVDFCNPVNGAVLSLTRDGYESADVKETSVEVAAGAEVVVGDGAYAFANFKGLGNINGSTSIKTWVIDVNEIVAGAQMQVTGNLTFPEGAVFEFENDEMLPTDGKTLVIGHADGAITGRLPSVHIDGSGNWSIFASGHDLKLCKQNGTVMILR